MISTNQIQIARQNDSNDLVVTETEVSKDVQAFGSYEVDVLSQFKANLNQLDELQSRFKFVLHEVSGLLAKK